MTTNNGFPDPNQYQLGRGHMMIDLFDSSGNPSGFYRHLGNATAFTLNVEEEVLEHTNKREELSSIDATVTLTKAMKGGFTLDEVSKENQALFYSGTAGIEDRVGAIDQTLNTIDNFVKTAAMDGRHVRLYANATNVLDGTTVRLRKMIFATGFSVVEVWETDTVTPVLLVLGTDYTIDEALGIIFFPESGNYTGAQVLTIRFASLEEDVPIIQMLESSVVRGRLLFRGENAQTGARYEVELNKVKLQADGDAAFVSDDFTTMQFQITAEQDTAYNPTSPVGTITRIDEAA